MIGDSGSDNSSARGRVFSVAIVVIFAVLMGRLVQLQLIDTSEYTGESRTNAMRETRVLAARGTIMDRNGVVLVDNEPAYSVLLTPRYFDRDNLTRLAELIALEQEDLQQRIDGAAKWSQYLPSPILHRVPFDRLARLLEQLDTLPGVSYEATQKRRYPSRVRAAHILGYVREIADRDLAKLRDDGYRAGDMMGQRGIERVRETALRGNMGSTFRLRNVHGQDVSSFRDGADDVASVGGRALRLTIDANLQALAESLFVGKRGAAVALDPASGEILALVSMPDFDLGEFTRQIGSERWAALNTGANKPLFNRATQSMLMPGSTWKPMIAMIALQAGVISPTEQFYCPGYHPVGGGRIFRCMHVHGNVNVSMAVQESCNTFFFEMMRRIDVNTFARYTREFGFGTRIETDLTEEETGQIPDSTYLNRTEPGWRVGTVMSLGVGQGPLGVTPLQLARYTAAIGSRGMLYTPHLVQQIADPVTGVLESPERPDGVRVSIDPGNVDLVRVAMRRVMELGTGRWLGVPGIDSGGKTGTAQNNRGEDDSVFIMFAPFDQPRIALAVVVENAGFGGTAAGPIASLMAEQYLTGMVTREYLVRQMLALESDPLPVAE
jgi:penicillin-binding protein 2